MPHGWFTHLCWRLSSECGHCHGWGWLWRCNCRCHGWRKGVPGVMGVPTCPVGGIGSPNSDSWTGAGVPTASIVRATSLIFSWNRSMASNNCSRIAVVRLASSVPFDTASFIMSPKVRFIDHSRCLRAFWNSPHKAPTLDVLYVTPPARDSTEWLMLAIDLASTSIDRTKSFCNDCVLPINTSNFSLLVLRAATMEVTPTASDVQADRTSNGLSGLGSGTFSLGLGDRDLPRSSSSLLSITGDLLWSSWCPCSPCSKPDSPRVPGPGMVGFSAAFISVGIAEPDAPAMKFSKRRVRARCTLSDSPGEMYSLGILCIPETRNTHADRYNNLINRRKNKNSSLIDDSHLR